MNTTSVEKSTYKTHCIGLFLSLFDHSINSQSTINFELDGAEKLVLQKNLEGDFQLSLKNSRPSENLFLGENSGDSISNSLPSGDFDGKYNTGIGNFTFLILDRGSMYTAVGKSAMAFTCSGSHNTVVVAKSFFCNYPRNNNVAIGK